MPDHSTTSTPSDDTFAIGARFGRWTVIGPSIRHGQRYFVPCRCECGTEREVYKPSLVRGASTSCGCMLAEQTRQRFTTHGEWKSRLHSIWLTMITRCTNLRSASYPNYGGRGISVCPEWRSDFVAFRDWALANGYRDDLTIERNDNDRDYEPGNCRWATRAEQNVNRRNNHRIEAFGETKTVAEWSRDPRCRVPHSVLRTRIWVGWDSERAIREPSCRKEVPVTLALLSAFGETKTLSEWSQDSRCSVNYAVISRRLIAGWHAERAITTPSNRRKK